MALERLAQVLLELELVGEAPPGLGPVELESGARGPGLMHGRFGGREQRFQVIGIVGEHGHARLRAHGDLVPGGDHYGGQPLEHSARDPSRRLRVADLREHDAELVAAEPSDEVGLPNAVPQRPGHVLQEPVAVLVSEDVVDLLEPVQVEVQSGQRLSVAPCHRERLLRLLAEEPAVGQSRQAVVVGQVSGLRRECLPGRDVPQDQEQAADHR